MPKKLYHNLRPAQVRALQKPGSYSDGAGLILRINESGRKSWDWRYRFNGEQRRITLGWYPEVSLADARKMVIKYYRDLELGEEPESVAVRLSMSNEGPPARHPAKRRSKEAATILYESQSEEPPTFRELAERLIELRRPTWTSERYAEQWEESLYRHAEELGSKRVDKITRSDVLGVLEQMWVGKTCTARRVRQRCQAVFDYAIAKEWRIDNPATTALTKMLGDRQAPMEHHAAVPFSEVPLVIREVRDSTAYPPTKLSFEFLVLCGSRSGEVRGAMWGEFDLNAAEWKIPAERMKARREHIVPLSDRAMEVLDEAWGHLGESSENRESPRRLVFPSVSGGMISNQGYHNLLRRLEIPCTVHGFRSSLRDWLAKEAKAPWPEAEACLAHSTSERESQGYLRETFLEERRPLMQAWANFVTGAA